MYNIYAPNILTPKHRQQTLTEFKKKTDGNKITIEGFNTLHSIMDGQAIWEVNNEVENLKDTIDLLDLIDIHRTFYPITAEYIFFSSVHGTLSRINQMLVHKTSPNKYK
jgi:hypothetical protein